MIYFNLLFIESLNEIAQAILGLFIILILIYFLYFIFLKKNETEDEYEDKIND